MNKQLEQSVHKLKEFFNDSNSGITSRYVAYSILKKIGVPETELINEEFHQHLLSNESEYPDLGSKRAASRGRSLIAKRTDDYDIWEVTGGTARHKVKSMWDRAQFRYRYRCDCPGQRQATDQMCSHAFAVLYAQDPIGTSSLNEDFSQPESLSSILIRTDASNPIEILVALSRDHSSWSIVRLAAAELLGYIGATEEAATILAGRLNIIEVSYIEQIASAELLASLGYEQKALKFITELIFDSEDPSQLSSIRSPSVILQGALALGRLGHVDKAAEAFRDLARGVVSLDPSQTFVRVRRAAAEALAWVGYSEESTEFLLSYASDSEIPVRSRMLAARGLGRLGHVENAVQILIEIARNTEVAPTERQSVAEELINFGDEENGSHILLELAQDKEVDPLKRLSAIEALLSSINTQETIRIVLGICQDNAENISVRQQAAMTFERAGWTVEAIESWLVLAQDSDLETDDVRQLSRAFERLGRPGGLLALARNEDIRLDDRQSIIEILLRRQAFTELLTIAQDDRVARELRYSSIVMLARAGKLQQLTSTGSINLEADVLQEAAVHLEVSDSQDVATEVWITLSRAPQLSIETQLATAMALQRLRLLDYASPMWLTISQQVTADLVPSDTKYEIATGLEQCGYKEEAKKFWYGLTLDVESGAIGADVKHEVARGLERFGYTHEAAELWLAIVLDSVTEPGSVENAIDALGQLGRTEQLATLASQSQTRLVLREAVANMLSDREMYGESAQIWLSLLDDVGENEWVRCKAGRSIGQIAGYLSADAGLALSSYLSTLDHNQQPNRDILKHVVWGLRETAWPNPASHHWLVPLMSGIFVDRAEFSELRDAAWEALSQIVRVAEQEQHQSPRQEAYVPSDFWASLASDLIEQSQTPD